LFFWERKQLILAVLRERRWACGGGAIREEQRGIVSDGIEVKRRATKQARDFCFFAVVGVQSKIQTTFVLFQEAPARRRRSWLRGRVVNDDEHSTTKQRADAEYCDIAILLQAPVFAVKRSLMARLALFFRLKLSSFLTTLCT
jgi:hypothetical protein